MRNRKGDLKLTGGSNKDERGTREDVESKKSVAALRSKKTGNQLQRERLQS